MAPKRKPSSQDETATGTARDAGCAACDTDQFRLIIQELLCDERVLLKMKKVLFPQNLADGVDYLKTKIDKLATAIEQRDARIEDLEKTVSTLETKLDGLEQYSRRANLRFQGLNETAGGEDVEGMIIDIINNDMGVTPPLQSTEIVRCHRIGRTPTEPGRPRAVLVKFQSERRWDAILRQRGNLKTTTKVNQRGFDSHTCAAGIPGKNPAKRRKTFWHLDGEWKGRCKRPTEQDCRRDDKDRLWKVQMKWWAEMLLKLYFHMPWPHEKLRKYTLPFDGLFTAYILTNFNMCLYLFTIIIFYARLSTNVACIMKWYKRDI